MGQIILVTGGARSGKSRFAESLFAQETDVVYLATAQIEDAEMAERVRQHQLTRPTTWQTIEVAAHLAQAVTQAKHYLLDCIGILTSRHLFELTHLADHISNDLQQTVADRVVAELVALIEQVVVRDGTLVMVTNEVGSAIVPEHQVARAYRDILGRVNQRVAVLCDHVYLVVCGIPLKIK